MSTGTRFYLQDDVFMDAVYDSQKTRTIGELYEESCRLTGTAKLLADYHCAAMMNAKTDEEFIAHKAKALYMMQATNIEAETCRQLDSQYWINLMLDNMPLPRLN